MTQEQKAKAYDEALNKAKIEINTKGIGEAVNLCYQLFPQLAENDDEESEAERIIEGFKGLLRGIKEKGGLTLNMVSIEKCEDWLERQKEQNPLFRQIHDSVLWDNGLRTGIELEKRQKQNGATINGEPIPTENHSVDIPLVEWSDEDEEVMEDLYNFVISDFIQDHIHETRWKPWKTTLERNRQNRLKSLRPQYHGDVTVTEAYKIGLEAGKASSWKPSEEQMAMLLAVINEPNNAGAESCHLALKSLHEHLKKLM